MHSRGEAFRGAIRMFGLGVFLIVVHAPAQAPDEQVTFKAGVNQVVVPVVVRTKDGQAVGDLTKDAFTLFDDGKRREIESFAVERAGQNIAMARLVAASGAISQSQTATAAPMVIPDHFIAYLFDDLGIRNFGDLAWARDGAMRHFDALLPGDRAAVFTTSCETMLDFTDNRAKLRETVSRLQVKPIPACGPLGQRTGGGPLASESLQLSLASSIAAVVKRTSAMPGQRSVVFISYGIAWRPDILEDLTNLAIRSKVVIDTLDARTINPASANASFPTQNITNPQQLERRVNNPNRAARSMAAQEGLRDLAEGTAGIAINNTNDADGAYRKMATPEWVYLLGFTPANVNLDKKTHEAKVHQLKVKVNDPRKLSLQARHSYYPPAPAGQQASPSEQPVEP
jgi:VWFA-related protein